ncbi:hypothetical protein D9757_002205 [Collybiopsis confluens]|uniref:Uncharacterized protein n=1 Tax=Collybiopsis confluens TaxID=2823264 RepID=A0A8H5I006_9AGAR|nr:hypothetical protein D9757_002205 [Collybiopsis confluens]
MSPWSQQEDDLLRLAVAKHGTQDNWKAVAEQVPGRNNKACRKRWLHSLSPSIKKSAWTTAEDALLAHLFTIHGPKWSFIARQIEGRTDDACSKRYNDALDPNLKREEWSAAEDSSLLLAFAEIGNKWREIGIQLQRSSLACRNRYKLLERKQKTSDEASLPSCSQPPNDLDPEFPYYPPESYPLFSPEETQGSFREPSPQAPSIPIPAPFQYSSSSLSAALEEPQAISQSFNEHVPMDFTHGLTPVSSLTSSPYSFTQEFNDGSTLLDDLSDPNLFTNILPTIYSHHSIYGLVPDENGICAAGPSQVETSSLYQPNTDSADKLPPALQELMAFPDQFFFNESPHNVISPELSPSPPASSPLGQSGVFSPSSPPPPSPFTAASTSSVTSISGLPASPSNLQTQIETRLISSAVGISSAELAEEPPSSQSLLFSTSHPKEVPPVKHSNSARKLNQAPARLSASLPLSDESLRPYACGHSTCWPNDASTSSACFSTARELFEHVKLHTEPEDVKPYRCALPGCNKFWKSLNGLQYHLQLSSSHFQQAMSKTFSSNTPDSGDGADSDSPDNSKRWVCDRPNCFKSYKNSSGLRYHKRHGHPTTLPMQLDNVPPALARSLPLRTRKMRKKDHNPRKRFVTAAA